MKICLITYADYYFRTILKTFEQSKVDYCEKHNYTFIFEDIDANVPHKVGWEKVKIVKRYIEDYDVVYMTDFDSVIVNDSVKIEDLVNKSDDMVISTLEDGFKLLGGSIWVNNDNTINLLNKLCECPVDNTYKAEEDALDKLDVSMYNIRINNSVNCIHGIHDVVNPLLLHFAGMYNPYTIKREYKNKVDHEYYRYRSS